MGPRVLSVLYLPLTTGHVSPPPGTTSIVFGENQLSPSLIGLSPLPTVHRNIFQHEPVRTSTRFYPRFILTMGRSLRFRVYPHRLPPAFAGVFALFRLAFAVAPVQKTLTSPMRRNSPDHNAKGTQSAAVPGLPPTPSLLPLVGMWFQALFHSPPRGAFHLSLTVLVRYRSHGSILALGGGPPSFTPDFSGRALLRNTATERPSSSPTGLSPSLAPRSRGLQLTSRPASAGPSTPNG